MGAKTLVYGYHAVFSIIEKRPESILSLSIQDQRRDQRINDLLLMAKRLGISTQCISKEALTKMTGHPDHQGVVAFCKELPNFHEEKLAEIIKDSASVPFFLVLDGIQDPHNLGACIRTAEAAGVQALIIPKDNNAPLTPTVRKVACGAAEVLPVITVTNLSRVLQKLKTLGVWVVGTDCAEEKPLYKVDLTVPLAIVLGNEEKGLRKLTKEHCDILATIPMCGTVKSLNVSVATGICLFEVQRQRATKF